MTEPRRSTVYDYSELRLHPDGTRVYQKPTNLRPAIAKVSVQNARSTWIARDAGGSGSVPKFRKKKGKVESTENAPEDETFKDADRQSSGDDGGPESLNLKRKPKRTDHRKAKKQKFIADYEYLNASTMASTSSAFDLDEPQEGESTLNEVPEPSPDLLKVIHRFASEFYTERGQLLNISRQFRKERKMRKQLREGQKKAGEGLISPSASPTPSSSSRGHSRLSSMSKSDIGSDDDSGHASGGNGSTRPKNGRSGRRPSSKLYTDMYKVLDGSAILALGMLVQEHILHTLIPQIPDEWATDIQRLHEEAENSDSANVGNQEGSSPPESKDTRSGSDEDEDELDESADQPRTKRTTDHTTSPPDIRPDEDSESGSEEGTRPISEDESSRSSDTDNSDSEDEHR